MVYSNDLRMGGWENPPGIRENGLCHIRPSSSHLHGRDWIFERPYHRTGEGNKVYKGSRPRIEALQGRRPPSTTAPTNGRPPSRTESSMACPISALGRPSSAVKRLPSWAAGMGDGATGKSEPQGRSCKRRPVCAAMPFYGLFFGCLPCPLAYHDCLLASSLEACSMPAWNVIYPGLRGTDMQRHGSRCKKRYKRSHIPLLLSLFIQKRFIACTIN